MFAVAATLLVFNLIDPSVSSYLDKALLAEWPSYAAYAISFSTIGVVWVNHHAVIDAIDRFDRILLFINGLLLLTVAVIPFPTGLLAHYLQAGHDQSAAAVAYGLTMTAMSLAFTFFNLYSRRYRRAFVHLDWIGLSFGVTLWPLATLAALFNVGLALALYALVVVFYIVLPIIRERSAAAAALRDRGSLGLAHERSGAAESSGSDLGEDS